MDPLLAIVGPTASGKTELAIALAERRGGEVVSCDSVQIYRGFDVGAAKPSAAERARARHHLIDVVDWDEPFDAARYVQLADAALTEISSRGGRPILCGGTGLYLRALRYGLVEVPPADPELRARLERSEAESPGSLFARLERDDPASAAAIDRRNRVQVMRALEILELTGEAASDLRARHGFAEERRPMRVLLLQRDRDQLRQRIAGRSSSMLTAGLLGEVEGLLAAGVDPDCRPMRAVGYREACAVVRGGLPVAGLAERIAQSTWHYAKRQLTWFRKERGVELLPVGDDVAAAAALVT